MSSIYKRVTKKVDSKTGKTVEQESKKWWGQYRDANGTLRRKALIDEPKPRQTDARGACRASRTREGRAGFTGRKRNKKTDQRTPRRLLFEAPAAGRTNIASGHRCEAEGLVGPPGSEKRGRNPVPDLEKDLWRGPQNVRHDQRRPRRRPSFLDRGDGRHGRTPTPRRKRVPCVQKQGRAFRRLPRPPAHIHQQSRQGGCCSKNGSNPCPAFGSVADDEHLHARRPAGTSSGDQFVAGSARHEEAERRVKKRKRYRFPFDTKPLLTNCDFRITLLKTSKIC